MNSPTILVIEDNPITAKMVRFTLESAGYPVHLAHDGRSGLAYAKEHPVGLILQDLLLPDTDGLQLVKDFRTLAGLAGVAILAMSGMAEKIEQARRDGLGFDAYLLKPVEPSRLLAVVAGYLPPPQAAEPMQLPVRGRHVLIADDDPIQQKLLRIRLEQMGHDRTSAYAPSHHPHVRCLC